jgi:hypothetical protein
MMYGEVISNSAGLFHRAILHSGSPLAFWAHYNETVDHQSFVKHVARVHGCSNSKYDDVVRNCLLHVPYKDFINKRGEVGFVLHNVSEKSQDNLPGNLLL